MKLNEERMWMPLESGLSHREGWELLKYVAIIKQARGRNGQIGDRYTERANSKPSHHRRFSPWQARLSRAEDRDCDQPQSIQGTHIAVRPVGIVNSQLQHPLQVRSQLRQTSVLPPLRRVAFGKLGAGIETEDVKGTTRGLAYKRYDNGRFVKALHKAERSHRALRCNPHLIAVQSNIIQHRRSKSELKKRVSYFTGAQVTEGKKRLGTQSRRLINVTGQSCHEPLPLLGPVQRLVHRDPAPNLNSTSRVILNHGHLRESEPNRPDLGPAASRFEQDMEMAGRQEPLSKMVTIEDNSESEMGTWDLWQPKMADISCVPVSSRLGHNSEVATAHCNPTLSHLIMAQDNRTKRIILDKLKGRSSSPCYQLPEQSEEKQNEHSDVEATTNNKRLSRNTQNALAASEKVPSFSPHKPQKSTKQPIRLQMNLVLKSYTSEIDNTAHS